ncbi:hypothetical protein Goari_027039 [Gossypium aridum]|uniref:PHD-type zinc finger plants domain-containing protein n=1 Tax=Gossypium aridum TaxID=34290 RepID=A0A7J8YSZ0_GOSAI|nr:hypothetical protein [Gossypium aridum]
MDYCNKTTHTNQRNMKISSSQQSSLLECCMCGDSGITQELFQCKICHFRSQHRYCSNLYPKAGVYEVCNWCLNQEEHSKEKSQNSLNSSASSKGKNEDDNNKNKKKADNHHGAGFKGNRRNTNSLKQQQLMKVPIKKPKLEEKMKRKRIIKNAYLEEKLRRTKLEEISKIGVITRHFFRNKVRRYKLLDEVSS